MSVMNTLMGGSGGIDSSGTTWIRFTDGTQICWYTASRKPGSTTNPGSFTWNFPKTFSSTPYVVVTPEYDKVYKTIPIDNVYNITTTGCTIYVFYTTGGGNMDSVNHYCIAIGRWK